MVVSHGLNNVSLNCIGPGLKCFSRCTAVSQTAHCAHWRKDFRLVKIALLYHRTPTVG
jgi:hypothetical protein